MGFNWNGDRGVGCALLLLASVLIFIITDEEEACFCMGGKTSAFVRNDYLSLDMPLDSDVFRVPPGYNAPQQVHITQGDHVGKGVIISWVTPDEPGSSTVIYWAEGSEFNWQAHGFFLTYKYFNYTSGYIHHCTIHNLEVDTKYYYEVGIGNTTRQFWFKTPPPVGPDVPYTFGLIGGIHGEDSLRELLLISLGFGLQGIMKLILLQNLVKLDHSSLILLVIMYHTEHRIVHLHCGILSRELQHTSLFCLLTRHLERVSNIAYNIVNGLCRPINDQSAPVYITIGDGGNLEGLATAMTQPQPSYSAYREASFGHGILDIKNRTHAHFGWNRNQDGYAVDSDSLWLHNRYWSHPEEASLAAFR